jgi:iron complex outermembrane recepter protein
MAVLRRAVRKAVTVALVALVVPVASAAAEAAPAIEFVIREERADAALTTFAQQAGVSVLFPYDTVSRARANTLVGAYRLEDGLRILLEGTGLEAFVEGTRLIVRRSDPASAEGASKSERKGILAAMASALGVGSRAVPPAAQDAILEEMVVTGSRIRRDDFSSAQPTTVINAGTIESLGIVNLGDAVSMLPANIGKFTPTAKPGGNESFPYNVFNGLNLANLRGLNPTYGSRTLTLVDSRRHVPTNQGDGVDLNMIPVVLIDRVEIVTGGASASYGSGAIGGVVNVLLDRNLDGGRALVDYGATSLGEGHDTRYAFAWGAGVGERGHLLLGVETQKLSSITDCVESRGWCARGAQVQLNPAYAAGPDPHYVYRENVRRAVGTTGVFPKLGVRFDESGTQLEPFAPPGPYGVGGDGQHVYLDTTLRSNVDRTIGHASYRHDLTEDLAFFVDISMGSVESFTPQDSMDLLEARLASDNYYLDRLPFDPCAGKAQSDCRISKDFSRDVSAANETKTDLTRVVLGFGGRFGRSTWTWDAYFQRGSSKGLQAAHESRHAERFLMALDAVDDGAGNPVCRVTRDGFLAVYGESSGVDPRLAEGCAPINIFGYGNISAEAYDFTHGRILERTFVEQNMLELVGSGDIVSGFGGGAVRAAGGFSVRRESIDNPADVLQPDYIRTDYQSQFGESFAGRVHVREYFGELDIPLAERVGLQLAGRRSEYENRAGAGTGIAGRSFEYDIDAWKISANWQTLPVLRLRASRSRDVRAPNFRELYYRKVFPAGSVFGFCSNEWTGNVSHGYFTYTGDPCVVDLRGGLDLEPEKANTATVGFVLTLPQRNFRIAADAYSIEIRDAVTPASQTLTLDSCRLLRDPRFCAQISGTLLDPADPLGGFAVITHVRPEALNRRLYEMRGVDVSADWVQSYRFGTLAARLIATHTIEQLVQPSLNSDDVIDVAGATGTPGGGADFEAAADWTAQWLTTFSRGAFSVTSQARYVSAGRKHYDRTGPADDGFDPNAANSIDDNRVPSYLLWSLRGAYRFDFAGMQMQAFGSVHNLFDRDPPLIGFGIAGTNPVYFDTIGRSYRIGLQARF